MCTTCGCGQSETRIEGEAHEHEHRPPEDTVHGHAHPHDVEYHYHGEVDHEHFHRHADGSVHSHAHAQDHDLWHGHGSDLHYGHGPAATHVPGMSQARIVQIEQDILAKNDAYAAQNRRRLRERGIFAVNLVSSPDQARPRCSFAPSSRYETGCRSASSKAISKQASMRIAFAPRVHRRSKSTPARAAISTRPWWVAPWSASTRRRTRR